jgi:dihydroorotate dehydrogenase
VSQDTPTTDGRPRGSTAVELDSAYDYEKPFSENRKEGPRVELDPAPDEVFALDARRELLGFPVGYPIGVPASPLTASAVWIKALADQGFNVLTYKTVRDAPDGRPAFPPPNWIFVEELDEPLSPDSALAAIRVVGGSQTRPRDARAFSMANSFGIPSPPTAEWQSDVREALRFLRAGQVLIVSVAGNYEELRGQELVDDFVRVALHAETALGASPDRAAAIELNLSCPNTVSREGRGARPICENADDTYRIVNAVRGALAPATKLVIKLSFLERGRLAPVVEAVASHVDAIAGINTVQVSVKRPEGGPAFRGTLTDPDAERPAGLSGVAIRDLALDFVRSLAYLRRKREWDFDIIGIGGVMEPHDVRALMASGADAVQTATAAANNAQFPRVLWGDGHPEPTWEERLLQLVTAALEDPRWAFRTLEGLARDLRVGPDQVADLLHQHPEVARRSAMTDREGRALYTTPDRRISMRERLERARWILAH